MGEKPLHSAILYDLSKDHNISWGKAWHRSGAGLSVFAARQTHKVLQGVPLTSMTMAPWSQEEVEGDASGGFALGWGSSVSPEGVTCFALPCSVLELNLMLRRFWLFCAQDKLYGWPWWWCWR